MLSEIELKMDAELARVVAYIKDELKDAIVAAEMQQIIEDEKKVYLMDEDATYYHKLAKAAKVVKAHYES